MELVLNEWIDIDNKHYKGMLDSVNFIDYIVLVKFDDGSYCLYDDEWNFALLTHYMIIKK